ncbi:transposase [Pseudomonas sp. SWRI79]|uniref:Transposase n=1 Tax=Pseudomonas farris TaxID=2841207 RepID=A0ABS6PV52_9PSED|nr:transposase [Pseudomonas farris]MBV4464350.1 transposase [Pseudomonas farris]
MRQHTTYLQFFKVQIVHEYLQSEASIAGAALRHGINANLVHE